MLFEDREDWEGGGDASADIMPKSPMNSITAPIDVIHLLSFLLLYPGA